MSMDRRSFLKSLAAAGLIPASAVEYAMGEPEAIEPEFTPTLTPDVSGYALTLDGRVVPFLSLEATREAVDITSHGDAEPVFLPGPAHITISVRPEDVRDVEPRSKAFEFGICGAGIRLGCVAYLSKRTDRIGGDTTLEFLVVGEMVRDHGAR